MTEEKKVSLTCLSTESEYSLRYYKNSCKSFCQCDECDDCWKPIEMKCSGRYDISVTEKGKSVVFYESNFFEADKASELMNHLLNATNWEMKNITIRGVEYPQPRLVSWYGPFPYSYSGTTLQPAEMPDCILDIKKKVEQYLKENGVNAMLNSVLLNLYRHNKDSVSWHSDDELSMGMFPTIASVSLGDTRRFEMRRKLKYYEDESPYTGGDEYFVRLSNGSLLIMDGSMQKDWQHRVPKEHHARHERINLTFRTVLKVESLQRSPDARIRKALEKVTKIHKKSFYEKTLDSDTNSVCSDMFCKTQDLNSLKAVIETTKSEEKNTESSFKAENETNEEICDDTKTNSYNKITLKTEYELNERDGEQGYELSHRKSSTHLNNFTDDKKDAKDIVNDSNYSSNNIANATAGKYKRLRTDSQSIATNSLKNIVSNDFRIKNKSIFSAYNRCTLKAYSENNTFDSFELKNLLNYDVDLINCKLFLEYANALKNRVLENINEFSLPVKAELEVLCKLTDGTQTEENQKLITRRMHSIIDEALKLQQCN